MGYCMKHYKRFKKYGDASTIVQVQGQDRKKHPLYSTYKCMRRRCYSEAPSNTDRKYYLDRGIKICDRWMEPEMGFWNFVEDMGSRPDGYSIERIDGDGNYEPGNCRWATATEQSRNRRNVK